MTMDRRRIATVMLVLSVVYGALVGILGMLQSAALPIVAIAGGALIAIGWVVTGLTGRSS
ncbi:MAG TPA: hypothetical protein VGD67_25650 [Pseudonocardiaceae bacterium]